ncbi:Vacuolar protein sorting-associated protein 26 [Friedmanniomyces endolithicus]|nr:Vacuolar protein sorting-associated protein 26 [Friedmanniomyces endolithicus]
MVVFVPGYHKGYKMGRRVKIIHRYMPREVGEVMVYYLCLVELFVPSLQVIARRQCDFCPWMWQARPEAKWAPGEDAAEERERGEAAALEEDAWSDAEEDWLSGVVPQTVEAAPRNVDGFGNPDRVRRVMYRETEAWSGVRTGVAMWRNAYPAIQLSGRRWTDIYEAPQAGAGDASIACVRARQAGHSPRMEEMIYGLLLTANSIATMTEQAQFRRVTIDWHRMLRFASSWIEHAVDADVEQRRQKEEQRARQRRWDRIRRIDIDATMTQLYGAGGGRIESGVRKDGKRLEHTGIKVQFVGTIEMFFDRGTHHEFLSLQTELASPGELQHPVTLLFAFKNVEKRYESYHGINVKLRYFLRVTVSRRMADVVREKDLWVYSYRQPPESNSVIKMDVGIEDCLHIEFEYSKSKYRLKDVIVGRIYFLLVRLKIRHMDLSIIRRETTGVSPNQYNESETLVRFEIMDGSPSRGETIPIRLFLGGFDLNPTFRDVNKKFSTRYYLSLVLIDEDARRYFKHSEIVLYRQAPENNDLAMQQAKETQQS